MNNSLISVIIPAHNNADTISTAIESMQKQTYKNLEIIVVDDNSTDNTKNIVESIAINDPRVKLIKSNFIDKNRYDNKLKRNINAGYSARNVGFKASSGELITLQDADDASLLNRIEVQYDLLKKHNADHVTLDWFKFDEKYTNKKLDLIEFKKDNEVKVVSPEEIYKLSQKTKGFVAKISTNLNTLIPFNMKRVPLAHKIFFGSLEVYPGTGNSPLFKRKVMDKVRFRPLKKRVWPSFMGRGADRDFNFQVAETFKNSFIFLIPLYMWRQTNPNLNYIDLEKYIN